MGYVVNGFTWNLAPSRAELLVVVLLEVEARGGVHARLATGFLDELLPYLEVTPDGATSATSGPNATKEARVDGYRDRRRRLR